MVNRINHLEPLSLAFSCTYQEPRNKPIILKPAQAIANEATSVGYNILTLEKKK
jgi:hypothetical protein